MPSEYYKLTASSLEYNTKYTFFCRVTKNSKRTNSEVIIGGDIERGLDGRCIRLVVHHGKQYAHLINVKHDARCCLDERPLAKGALLLHAMVNFIATKYPDVKIMEFQDESYFDCNKGVKPRISLAQHNMLVYGRTWYERVLCDSIDSTSTALQPHSDYRDNVAITRSAFLQPLRKDKEVSWTHLKRQLARYTRIGDDMEEWLTKHKAALKDAYVAANTIRDFARLVHELSRETCVFFGTFVDGLYTYAGVPPNVLERASWKARVDILGQRLKDMQDAGKMRFKIRSHKATQDAFANTQGVFDDGPHGLENYTRGNGYMGGPEVATFDFTHA